jgi:signal transduction histidine kinase
MRLMLDSLLQNSRYNSSAIAGKTAKLEDVVRDALSAFDTEALGVNVDTALNGADDVRCDPILPSHVLQNLIGNAAKFRPPLRRPSPSKRYLESVGGLGRQGIARAVEPSFA